MFVGKKQVGDVRNKYARENIQSVASFARFGPQRVLSHVPTERAGTFFSVRRTRQGLETRLFDYCVLFTNPLTRCR